MSNSFQTALPGSTFLQKCIAYYYFEESGDASHSKSFIYYPHYKNALSIYKNCRVTLKHEFSSLAYPANNCYSFGYSKLISSAAQAELQAPFTKIGVVFQPLGLNHFLEGNLSDYVPAPINVDFDVFKDTMLDILPSVFDAAALEEKVTLLDNYFLSVFKGFKDKKMEDALHLLFAEDAKYSVESLAEALQISRKTLLRLFKKHQNCSVIDYMKLIQFRKSVEIFQNSKDKTKLTELAHNTAYYDQSDFIKHFKKLTGFNPKSFFENLTILGDQGTFWTLR
jgi:AraC-like DNA-binding protein